MARNCLSAVALLRHVSGFSSAFTFVPQRFIARSGGRGALLRMSDDQPSDSSDEFAVDVQSETVQPNTEGEVIVNSILDDLPLSLDGKMNEETRIEMNESLLKLEALNPTKEPTTSNLLNGVWTLRYSGGYSSEWALPSPTRQVALFLYSGGYSPGLFALTLANQLPSNLVDVGELELTISRTEQPRIEAKVGVAFLGGAENEITLEARLDVESDVRFRETYDNVANFLGREVEIPEALRYTRDLYVTYLDNEILIVRDASGVPDILVRK